MINILINEPDTFYREGLVHILRELFLSEYGEEIAILSEFSPACIWKADVIILSLCQGEAYTCKQEFKFRNRGVVIGLTNSCARQTQILPSCYRDMVHISRRSARECLYDTVVQTWNERRHYPHYPPDYTCYKCKQRSLSEREYFIAEELLAGKTVTGIARDLNISEKAVYAHKYALMRKYNLSGTWELFIFLSHLNRRGFFPVRSQKTHFL
ncbi:response regulator transcription factor [Salmonella enterica]